MCRLVPTSSFHEHSVDETSIIGWLCNGGRRSIVANLKVETKLINGNLVFTGIVLKSSREESLWEEETRDPEGRRSTLFDPFLEEANPIIQVENPRSQWFK